MAVKFGGLSREFLFQVGALVVAVVIVHSLYTGVVRPNANEALEEQRIQLMEEPERSLDRSLWVIVMDPEQEVCFILLFWSLALMFDKGREVVSQRRQLGRDLVPVGRGQSILPEDARDYARAIEVLEPRQREGLYARALHTALQRFRATRNLHDVSESVESVCRAEHERMDSELGMVRYMAWAIPSIGFIGTVRGIGAALSMAHQAVEGDITGVTASLGTAFNSTLIALLLSIILMFVLYQLQQFQERLVLDTQSACDRNLLQFMQVR
ncbi:MAG: MotA/TolQ/ExbB proton channel family protein [Wenzhouxiangellaceae bacterium]|jgi:biopolymer transport protein ExbB/TolQ|nr:MotA/TolQ/ExbB proton channel family protein [Wenzhouxiangellaceae bacterium]MBS3747241.1 MotA/TolQ/ExbB proton channel family protein [Wenzhouxiangellaceae bacterium]MBS3823816.1 MotA/TolQ/ExbB proton channel family protein [Wenzhouxiangellaceae bacterium]